MAQPHMLVCWVHTKHGRITGKSRLASQSSAEQHDDRRDSNWKYQIHNIIPDSIQNSGVDGPTPERQVEVQM